MKPQTTVYIEAARVRKGRLGSDETNGFNGLFIFASPMDSAMALRVICSDGLGWEHVSVSTVRRTPTWEEMCWIKDVFWDAEECVTQFHPPKSKYVNCHKFCLHLWKPTGIDIPTPPEWMVGPIASAPAT